LTIHLLRLMWNRKRRNALLCLEIFCCFIVVAAIAVIALNYANNLRHDVGYDYRDVWNAQYSPPVRTVDGSFPEGTEATARALLATASTLNGVQSVGAIGTAPYSSSESRGNIRLKDGRRPIVFLNGGSDGLENVLRLELAAGRWFEPVDSTGPVGAIVINQRLAEYVFGDADPIGQLFPDEPPDPPRAGTVIPRGREWRRRRVVGVVRDFKKNGEFGTPQYYMFGHITFGPNNFGNSVMVRTAAGMPAAFEETLQKQLQAVAREWTVNVRLLERDRRSAIRTYLAFLLVPAVIAAFLMLMVALGLIGVLWQHVTERTREFGLRRAHGASAHAIRRQVLGELVILASFAVVPGAILGLQLPALPIPDYLLPGRVIIAGVLAAVAVIYVMVLACGWYPSRMATAIEPAEALHYE
jgi:putative ABC transport system permease protein